MDGTVTIYDKPRHSRRKRARTFQEFSMRPSERPVDAMRTVTIETGVNRYAEGSCLISFGHTRVLVTASLEEGVPGFLRGKGQGWVTAEYGMLPRATHTRGRREAAQGKQSGRTQEIQRLIGRSMRAIVDLKALGERQISIDCDVIQADGGTRTASITGAWVALRLATKYLLDEGLIVTDPILDQVAAISCGVFGGTPVLDLDYEEDSNAEADANFVLTGKGDIVEIQATGEKRGFSEGEFESLFSLARKGIGELCIAQRAATGG
jgi:ribonuclease PH